MKRRSGLVVAGLSLFLAMVPIAEAAPPLERVIVVLQPDSGPAEEAAKGLAQAFGGTVGFVYQTALQGFSMTVPGPALEGLRHHPLVAYIEPDVAVAIAQTGGQVTPTGVDRVDADLNPPASPMNVDIAIIDTGVYIGTTPTGQARSHLDLNLVYVTDCTQAIFYPTFGGCSGSGNFQDENGHGTHVAGIAAAKDNDFGSIGTAPGAVLWSVKVLNADGTGYMGSILAGIDFVAAQAASIEVANMSLGFVGSSAALDTSIANAVSAGVVFVVAAGNDAIDASQFSPAAHPDVITVSALADFDGQPGGLGAPTCRPDVDDTLADFSNYGPLVEMAAPGVCIYSTFLNDGYLGTYSGTSMASPYVAGAVARYIAQNGLATNNRADVMAIRSAVIGAGAAQSSACGFSGDPDSNPEPLLYLNSALFGGTGVCNGSPPPPPPPNQPPVAGFTYSCTDLTCAFTNTSTDPNGDPLAFTWDFGDGTAGSNATSPTHTFPAGGSYVVNLTANDGNLTDVATSSVTVTEPANPVMTVAVYPILIAANGRTATISMDALDANGTGVPGVNITGTWTYTNRRGQTRTVNQAGVTNSSGTLTLSYTFPRGSTVMSYCVSNATKTNWVYQPTVNCGYPLT
ncbi:MAG: S8 family serine peptidase [Actinomycetota bacterium]